MTTHNSDASGNNINVEYLKNGVYDNNLKDETVTHVTTSLQHQEFRFSKMFTESNAIKELQSSSSYTDVIKNVSCSNMDTPLNH